MKKILFILFCLIMLGLLGCKKKPFDYRNKYLGNYQFTVTRHHIEYVNISGVDTVIHWDTTYTTSGNITYLEKANDEIYITIFLYGFYNSKLNKAGYHAKIYEDGSFSHGAQNFSGENIDGEFENKDFVKFNISAYSKTTSDNSEITGYKQ